jgi:hypothetical protein
MRICQQQLRSLDAKKEAMNMRRLLQIIRERLTDFAAGEAGFFVIRSNVTGQSYWYPGISIDFLTRLASESGDHGFVEGARRYVEVIAGLAGHKYKTLASGNVG